MERRLAAIMFTDMVGYSRLIALDEPGTIRRQKEHRDNVIDPAVAERGGRIVKSTGDGILAEFSSLVGAVECAVKIQQGIAEQEVDVTDDRRIAYRIGINLGDVVFSEDDVFGDGVNLAARLEPLAEPGGICISSSTYDHLEGKTEVSFVEGGEHSLKNIPRPIKIWQWIPSSSTASPELPKAQSVASKLAIAVLPFENMSSDPEQEFLSDGIAEDVITILSRFRSLFVIARNSSFSFKGRNVTVPQVAKELSVRYVVEGSVRKAGDRVRITAQLIDAANGNQLWADRFDGVLDDIFELQDEISRQIVSAIEPEVQSRERALARRRAPENLNAWELVHRGNSSYHRGSEADHSEAIRLFQKVTEADPEYAPGYAHLAFALFTSAWLGRSLDYASTISSARRAAEAAVSLDRIDPLAHYCLGRLHLAEGNVEMAINEMQTAININPSYAGGYQGLGYACYYGAGQAEQAIEHFDTALSLNPRNPLNWSTLHHKGSALRFMGRVSDAIDSCRRACQEPECGYQAYMNFAAALADAGQIEGAREAMDRAKSLQPALSARFLIEHDAVMNKCVLESLLGSLQKIGPDE